MRWVALAARVLVGLSFFVFGLAYFVPFLPMDPPPLPERAATFGGVLGTSGYLTVVKALEIVGGLLVLSGRFTPLGLVLVTPVAVNIALWDLLLVGQPALGVVLTALCLFLVGYYWRHFAGVFAPAPVV
jgi:putative oxidoreductase